MLPLVIQQHMRDLMSDDVRLVPGSGALLVEDVMRPGGADPQAAWISRPGGEGVQEDQALALQPQLGHEPAEVERLRDLKFTDDRGAPPSGAPHTHFSPRHTQAGRPRGLAPLAGS
jgi:hypothetical protein